MILNNVACVTWVYIKIEREIGYSLSEKSGIFPTNHRAATKKASAEKIVLYRNSSGIDIACVISAAATPPTTLDRCINTTQPPPTMSAKYPTVLGVVERKK